MKKLFCAGQLVFLLLISISFTYAQDNVGIGTTTPDPGAILELLAPDKGFLMTRLNSTDTTIPALNVEGMMYYAQDINMIMYYDGGSWLTLSTGVNYWGSNGTDIFNLNSGGVAIGTNTALGNLHVENTDWNSNAVYLNSTGTSAGSTIRFVNPQAGNHTYDIIGSTGSGAATGVGAFGIWDNTDGAYRLVIQSSGSVGIGGTGAVNALDVNGSSVIGSGYFGISAPSNGLLVQGNVGIGSTVANAPLQFATANTNRKIVLFEGANNDHEFFGFGTNGAELRYQINQTFSSHVFWAGANSTTSNELMRIQGNGNVGIGNNNPTTKLEVRGTSPGNGNGIIEAYHDGGFGFGLVASNSSVGDNSGTIYSRARIAGVELNPTGSNNTGVWGHQFDVGAGGWGVLASNGASETAPARYAALAGSAAFPYAGVFMGGNVGIGNTTPLNPLHVTGDLEVDGLILGNLNTWANSWTTAALYNPLAANGASIYLLTADAGATTLDGAQISLASGASPDLEIANREAGGIDFFTNGYLQQMTLDAAGDLGIGTSSPTYDLTIGRTGAVFGVENASSFVARNSGGTYDTWMWPRWTDNIMYMNYGTGGFHIRNNASTTTMFMTNGGFVGIGTATPLTTLHVNHPSGTSNGLSISNSGDADRWHFYMWSSNTLRLYYNGAQRGSFDPTTGIYTPISDLSLKENITDLENPLEKIKQLRPVEYRFKQQDPSNQKRYMGFIAQEVLEIYPSLVSHSDPETNDPEEGPEVYTLDYSGFGVIAIKAIQEQQKIIEELRARIESLERK